MSEMNWGQLLKKQDELVYAEELQKKQRSHHLKQLYKLQLEKMINQHQQNSDNSRKDDHEMIRRQQQTENLKIAKEQEKQLRLKMIKHKFAHQNLLSTIEKRYQEHDTIQKEKRNMNSRFQKLQTEISQQKYSILKKRQQFKAKLADAYNQQINQQQFKKHIAKIDDRRYSEVQAKLSYQQQMDRLKYLHKIKFGYRQNPQTLQVAERILQKNNEQRNKFLEKMQQDQKNRIIQEEKRLMSQEKMRKVKETSQFNRGYYEKRADQKRNQSIKQTLMQHQQWQIASQQIHKETEQKQKRQQEERKRLKQELERQISQSASSKNKQRYLNNQEEKINKQLFLGGPSFLPGLAQDHSLKRQQLIIEQFLK